MRHFFNPATNDSLEILTQAVRIHSPNTVTECTVPLQEPIITQLLNTVSERLVDGNVLHL
jgi:hypothetical protein